MLLGAGQDRVLCAVSGGADSMALLACLWELAPRLRLTIEVATVDHGLRAEAAGEAALVEERAAALGLRWHGLTVDVAGARRRASTTTGPRVAHGGPASSDVPRGGVQEVARRLRLDALAALAERRGLGCVALAHQADDQAETVLFRILRGTGVGGLAGIPYRRQPFIRPLLDVGRADILKYLGRRSLPFVQDPSNDDPHYARARIRHQILPLLRRENPRVDEALRSLALSSAAYQRAPKGPAWTETVAAGTPVHVRSPVHVPVGLGNEIDAVAREGHGTRSFDVAGGARVTVSYGRVHVAPRRPEASAPDATPEEDLRIAGPGSYAFGPWRIEVTEASAPDGSAPEVEGRSGAWAWFDARSFAWPLLVRRRRPGDRMRPRGGTGGRKLSDLLIDAKIPRGERARLPVILAPGGDLLFVPGLRPGRAFPATDPPGRWIGLAVAAFPDHDAVVDPSSDGSNTQRAQFKQVDGALVQCEPGGSGGR